MGKAVRILSFEIVRDRNEKKIWLNQNRYTDQMLRRFNMYDCDPYDTPMAPKSQLSKKRCPTSSIAKIKMQRFTIKRLCLNSLVRRKSLPTYLSTQTGPATLMEGALVPDMCSQRMVYEEVAIGRIEYHRG
ncbi:hypothetical protein JTB14_020956 [Gonioctena quinquepunctata]|nr:hypothetical protein JTB14_020956 [Gonioctena quinquepunctata]